MNPDAVWETTLEELQHQMARNVFNTWFRGASLVSAENDTYTIGVESENTRNWLQSRMQNTVNKTLTSIAGHPSAAAFVVAPDTPVVTGNGHYANGNGSSSPSYENDHQANGLYQNGQNGNHNGNGYKFSNNLNYRYTFSTFVVGHNNRLAHAAAQSVAERPGETYNPLFIYGGVGLGKTHLLHAVGHECLKRGLSVRYVSSETFTNDLIAAIRSQKTAEFREKYRTPDLLLIDDIQFIAGKESTQEELFHTFNDLHSRGKQVILSSDRPPRAMHTLEERLKSRFEWGLMADIQLPDHETRIAILQNKAEEKGIIVPEEVMVAIAHHIRNNIRELEGALNKVLAYAQLNNTSISIETADLALQDLIRRPEKVTMDEIIDTVCNYFSVTPDKLCGKGRTRSIAYPRQVAMYLCRTEAEGSFPQIGARLGNRDHTTIMHGYEKISAKTESDSNIRRDIIEIRSLLFESQS